VRTEIGSLLGLQARPPKTPPVSATFVQTPFELLGPVFVRHARHYYGYVSRSRTLAVNSRVWFRQACVTAFGRAASAPKQGIRV
jgi:hypothetical protein